MTDYLKKTIDEHFISRDMTPDIRSELEQKRGKWTLTDLLNSISPDDLDVKAKQKIREELETRGRFDVHAIIKKAEETEDGIFVEGYASTRDIDRMTEIILPKAFRRSLRALKSGRVHLMYEHVPDPVGKIVAARIDKNGLWIRAKLFDADPWNVNLMKVRSLLNAGGLKAFSVGFITIAAEWKTIDDVRVRVITDLDLLEISLVSIPANVEAIASVGKSLMFGSDLFMKTDDPDLQIESDPSFAALTVKTVELGEAKFVPVVHRLSLSAKRLVLNTEDEEPSISFRRTAKYLKELTDRIDKGLEDIEREQVIERLRGIRKSLSKGK